MLDQVLPLLLEEERFFLTTHISPDGDAIGSQLAMGRFLRKMGKHVTMINADAPPDNLGWLPEIDLIEVFDGSISQRKRIDDAGVVVMLDTNALKRIGKVGRPVKNSTATKVLVDHHTNAEKWFDATYVRDTASSTAELVYEIICAHDADLIDTDIAEALYTGIMTDTGSFRYAGVTPHVHRIVADLLERGDLTPAPIHTAVFDTRSTGSLRLLGRVLDSLTLCYGEQVGYMVIPKRLLHDTDASSDDTDGFVNYPLSIEGVKAAVLFLETEKGTKVSFRSKGDTFVNEWARSFGGGGHRNASGAFVKRSLDEVIDDVVAAAPRYLHLEAAEDDAAELSAEDASYLSSLMEMKGEGG